MQSRDTAIVVLVVGAICVFLACAAFVGWVVWRNKRAGASSSAPGGGGSQPGSNPSGSVGGGGSGTNPVTGGGGSGGGSGGNGGNGGSGGGSNTKPSDPLPVASDGKTYSCNATYYGPDEIHGIHGGNDNIFEHIPAGQYTPDQLHKIGSHFCAMTEAFLRKGFMGKVIRITGSSKKPLDFVVVDLLPDRNDGKNVHVDIHDQKDWLALGGDKAVGIQPITFQVVGKASIPVPDNSPWAPQKFGF